MSASSESIIGVITEIQRQFGHRSMSPSDIKLMYEIMSSLDEPWWETYCGHRMDGSDLNHDKFTLADVFHVCKSEWLKQQSSEVRASVNAFYKSLARPQVSSRL